MRFQSFDPVYDSNSKILILGSFPSVKSRETGFYYGNPLNRFWKLLAKIYAAEVPQDIESKKRFLLSNNIALWDVIRECEIKNSSDSSIRNPEPNDVSGIISKCSIERIFTNGNLAHKLYAKHIEPSADIAETKLPSTSPANAAWSFERLYGEWKIIKF